MIVLLGHCYHDFTNKLKPPAACLSGDCCAGSQGHCFVVQSQLRPASQASAHAQRRLRQVASSTVILQASVLVGVHPKHKAARRPPFQTCQLVVPERIRAGSSRRQRSKTKLGFSAESWRANRALNPNYLCWVQKDSWDWGWGVGLPVFYMFWPWVSWMDCIVGHCGSSLICTRSKIQSGKPCHIGATMMRSAVVAIEIETDQEPVFLSYSGSDC
jgi:hypothetical protein